MKKLMIRLPIYYLIVVSGMYLLQDFFIYHPERSDPQTIAQVANSNNLRLWPDMVDTYRGFVSEGNSKQTRGTILVFHGNAGKALDRIYYATALNRLDYRVVLAEYPGYGSRPGKVGEKPFTTDALETIRQVRKDFGGPIFLLGESLGCGVVCAAVAKTDVSIDGVALITPWDTLPNLAQALYWFLPARWIVKDRYDNVANLASYRGPVAVILAGQDEIIPNRLTRRLYEALPDPKRLWEFPQAGHNSWPSGSQETWWRQMMKFLQPTAAGNDLK
jgi:alpha-beta hydrolase superfamily lysophospholipase